MGECLTSEGCRKKAQNGKVEILAKVKMSVLITTERERKKIKYNPHCSLTGSS